MAILTFLIQLAGAVMLLLFAVRLVRTGIERRFGAGFGRLLSQEQGALRASAVGVALAVVLQSSAAVALLASGFAASGLMSFGAGLAVVLGGDLGSALIIQVLSYDLAWLVPVLLATGGYMFVKVEAKTWRQIGRVLMGIALILISLRFLREAVDPIRTSEMLPAIADYLARDFVTAFLVGAVLAFIMHSSVAAILMCVTLVQIQAIPLEAGLSLVMGANFGSAFIPVWLTRDQEPKARRIPAANLMLRGSWAIVAVAAINLADLPMDLVAESPAQALILAHLAFNALLLVLALPFVSRLEPVMTRAMPDAALPEAGPEGPPPGSALSQSDRTSPQNALASLKREVLRMSDLVERMFAPSLQNYSDASAASSVKALEAQVNESLEGVRRYVAGLGGEGFEKEHMKTARDLMEYAIRLETAGDVVAKRLAVLAENTRKAGLKFSPEGWKELSRMHRAIGDNLKLASNVLVSDDLESARLLSLEKTEIKRSERDSRKRHLKRLQAGLNESFETSDIHLETLRAFREFNSHIAAVAYPILYKNGQLLETRLIEDMPKDTDDL